MIKTMIANRHIKREVGYLLEASSINWKVIPNSKQRLITLKSVQPDFAWIKVSMNDSDFKCGDLTKEKEIKRIIVGLKIALDDVDRKLSK